MIRLRIILCIFLMVFSCKNNTIERPPKPKNLIPKEKMVDILYDMSLLSAAKGVNKRVIENKGINPEDYIYQKHKIDSLQFVLSNTYYSYDLKTYEKFFAEVKLKLQADKKEINEEIEIEKKRRDSIRKSRQTPKKDSLKTRSQVLNDTIKS